MNMVRHAALFSIDEARKESGKPPRSQSESRASWEGFALEEVTRLLEVDEEDVYFWGVHEQVELDMLVVRGGKKMGFEFKYGSAPRLTRSLTQACELLDLESLTVVTPGDNDYPLADTIRVLGLATLIDQLG